MKKSNKESVSVRIPFDYYEKLKELAKNNKRPLISELIIILDDHLITDEVELQALRRLRAIRKTAGIIKNLPKGSYAQTIDDELYGKIGR